MASVNSTVAEHSTLSPNIKGTDPAASLTVPLIVDLIVHITVAQNNSPKKGPNFCPNSCLNSCPNSCPNNFSNCYMLLRLNFKAKVVCLNVFLQSKKCLDITTHLFI